MVTDPIPKGLKKIYASKFPSRNLHHIIPRSREGLSTQFNLYPYDKRAHSAYHDIFLNMRIDEVWEALPLIHQLVFESSVDHIYTPWLMACALEVGPDIERKRFEQKKLGRLGKTYPVELLQTNWELAFGSDSLDTARRKMKEMMLYMIFGVNMINNDILFDNGNLADFIELSPCDGDRLWAFQTCFGKNGGSIQSIKSKIVWILNKN